jgi:hypothetical protein
MVKFADTPGLIGVTVYWVPVKVCPSSSTMEATLVAIPQVMVVLTSAGLSRSYWAVVGEMLGGFPIAVMLNAAGSPYTPELAKLELNLEPWQYYTQEKG